MPARLRQLTQWLEAACGLSHFTIEPASADASFRSYFRVFLADGDTRIVMDAPPGKEDVGPFLAVAELLSEAQLHVPAVYAQDVQQGFVLLEDLGDQSYLRMLDGASVERLYGDAMNALLHMQQRVSPAPLPPYDRALLEREIGLFGEWLLRRHLGLRLSAARLAMLERAYTHLLNNAAAQPVVCVHRDYHSRNLMVVRRNNPGVIDFQDAVAGPVTYDLVSLLRDCYIRWTAGQVDAWVERYHAAATDVGLLRDVAPDTFREWFDLMGVQRHLKAAGIFARLYHRDGKGGYLADIPRTLGYIVEVGLRRHQMDDLAEFIAVDVIPRL